MNKIFIIILLLLPSCAGVGPVDITQDDTAWTIFSALSVAIIFWFFKVWIEFWFAKNLEKLKKKLGHSDYKQ